MFGDAPAVLPRQVREQPEQETARPASGLDPGEPPSHLFEQLVGLGLSAGRPYSVAHDHRLII
jgi:hypothetical protein